MTQPIPQGYKQTEIGVIPEDWEVKSLGEIAIIKDGTHQTPKYQESGVPFYSVEHVTNDDFQNTKFISEQEHQFLTRSFSIEKGDILMTRIGSIGECKLIDWNVRASFYVSLALLKIRGAYAKYIAQYSNYSSFKREIELHSLQHATPKKINLGPISDVKISLPPTEIEQTAIATALSDVDALISGLESLIAKKQAIKTATMQQLLTGKTRLPQFAHHPDGTAKGYQQTELGLVPEDWEVEALGDISEVKMCKRVFSHQTSKTGKIPFFKIGTFGDEPDAFIAETLYDELKSKFSYPEKGDVLISVSGTLGRTVVFNGNPSYFQDSNIVWLQIDKQKISNDFLYHYYKIIKWASSEGSTISRLYNGIIKASYIAVPPLEEQTAIAQILSDMEEEIQALETRLSKTKQIKQGMMQVLLTGKVRLV